jgi:hypothetical protein
MIRPQETVSNNPDFEQSPGRVLQQKQRKFLKGMT